MLGQPELEGLDDRNVNDIYFPKRGEELAGMTLNDVSAISHPCEMPKLTRCPSMTELGFSHWKTPRTDPL